MSPQCRLCTRGGQNLHAPLPLGAPTKGTKRPDPVHLAPPCAAAVLTRLQSGGRPEGVSNFHQVNDHVSSRGARRSINSRSCGLGLSSSALHQRTILAHGGQAEVGPDPPQTVKRPMLRSGHVVRIVPNQPASQCRQISQQSGTEDEAKCEQIPQTGLGRPRALRSGTFVRASGSDSHLVRTDLPQCPRCWLEPRDPASSSVQLGVARKMQNRKPDFVWLPTKPGIKRPLRL